MTLRMALCLLLSINAWNIQTNLPILDTLDMVIEQKDYYLDIKRVKIQEYKSLLESAVSRDARFRLSRALFQEYQFISLDSAIVYVHRENDIVAGIPGYEEKEMEARLNLADCYMNIGMYKEACDLIDIGQVPDTLALYYSYICKTLFNRMSDYAVTPEDKVKYNDIASSYREKMLVCLNPDEFEYFSVLAEKLIDNGQTEEARKVILSSYPKAEGNEHFMAYYYYTLARICKETRDDEGYARYLALTAISDFKAAILDYISLRELSVLLYKKGDFYRAYKYLTLSIEDALTYNSRLRIVESNEAFPIIHKAYSTKRLQQEKQLKTFLLIIVVLLLILLIIAYIQHRQKKKLEEARVKLHDANELLKSLNDSLISTNGKLDSSNTMLKQANTMLNESNKIKEEYIARYMDLCTSYIDKQEQYMKSMYLLAKIDDKKGLLEGIRNSSEINNEFKEFYRSFDETFLTLFPTFVEEFNSLLQEDTREYPIEAGSLTTKLRIFALIRLGINDSTNIAKFLHLGVTTIYNYRSRTRNKAIGDPEKFETLLMNIGYMHDLLLEK